MDHLQLHKILQSTPKDKYEDKAIQVINSCSDFVIDAFRHRNTETEPLPSSRKMEKAVSEYSALYLSEFKSLTVLKDDVDFGIINLTESVRTGIVQPKLESIGIVLKAGGRARKYLIDYEGDVLSASSYSNTKYVIDGLPELTKKLNLRINELLEAGCLRACSLLYLSGEWFTDYSLNRSLYKWLIESNAAVENALAESVKENVQRIVHTEIGGNIKVECLLTKDGGYDVGFPPFAITVAATKDGDYNSVFFPQLTNTGWSLQVITDEGNFPEAQLTDFNQITNGVNKQIEKTKKIIDSKKEVKWK